MFLETRTVPMLCKCVLGVHMKLLDCIPDGVKKCCFSNHNSRGKADVLRSTLWHDWEGGVGDSRDKDAYESWNKRVFDMLKMRVVVFRVILFVPKFFLLPLSWGHLFFAVAWFWHRWHILRIYSSSLGNGMWCLKTFVRGILCVESRPADLRKSWLGRHRIQSPLLYFVLKSPFGVLNFLH